MELPRLERLKFYSPRELAKEFPELRTPLIDGLIRLGDTMNIVAPPKVGKSWFAQQMGLSVATGRKWLGFDTLKGRVLLIDGELPGDVLNYRLTKIAHAMGLKLSDYRKQMKILPMRSSEYRLRDFVDQLETWRGEFKLIIIDPKYKFTDPGASENDNSAEASFWSLVNRLAEKMESAIALIHHSSKGLQGDKAVTDVGAGASAQARAADCHLVLREHQDRQAFVLDAVVRSFAPVEPAALRWEFPLWEPDDDLDPQEVKGRLSKGEEAQRRRYGESEEAVLEFCADAWRSRNEISEEMGWGDTRVNGTIRRLKEQKLLRTRGEKRRGHECEVVKAR